MIPIAGRTSRTICPRQPREIPECATKLYTHSVSRNDTEIRNEPICASEETGLSWSIFVSIRWLNTIVLIRKGYGLGIFIRDFKNLSFKLQSLFKYWSCTVVRFPPTRRRAVRHPLIINSYHIGDAFTAIPCFLGFRRASDVVMKCWSPGSLRGSSVRTPPRTCWNRRTKNWPQLLLRTATAPARWKSGSRCCVPRISSRGACFVSQLFLWPCIAHSLNSA